MLLLLQFNLEIPESSLFKDNIRLYRTVSSAQSTPPFELQVLLSVPELNNNQVLVHVAPDSSRVRVDPPPRFILLETWAVNFASDGPQHSADVAPSTIYKRGIALFRSVYALLRILPTWKSHSPFRRRVGGSAGAFTLQLRLGSGGPDDRILAFSKSQDFSPITACHHLIYFTDCESYQRHAVGCQLPAASNRHTRVSFHPPSHGYPLPQSHLPYPAPLPVG